jgi:CRP/FNR family transcriptional regulator, cyclic AMP receptor protein
LELLDRFRLRNPLRGRIHQLSQAFPRRGDCPRQARGPDSRYNGTRHDPTVILDGMNFDGWNTAIMAEKLWYLKRCNFFERLTPSELEFLESRSRVRTLPPRAPVYLPADQADSVLLLAEGRVKLCHLTPDGKQSILAFIDPGELFGELSLIADGTRDEYAETVEASTIVLIPGEAMQKLLEQRPDVTLGITKLIGLRRRRIERRLKNLLFRSNRERLTHLLLELVEQYGRQTADGVRLALPLSHQELANIIGSTRETVTVLLGELQSERLLTVGRRKITIRDVERLARSVQTTAPHPPQATSPPPASSLRTRP